MRFSQASVEVRDGKRPRSRLNRKARLASPNIINAANRCIEVAPQRLKQGQTLRVDSTRKNDALGGRWSSLDNTVRGKVQILRVNGGHTSQAVAAIEELKRLSELDSEWRWDRCAIVARNWSDLEPARSACVLLGIPAQSGREETASFWRARETQALLRTLESRGTATISRRILERHRTDYRKGPWGELLAQALEELLLEESGAKRLPVAYIRNWLGEWSREVRRKQQGLLLTSAHRAKGLEFDHVAILDGRWQAASRGEDFEAPRRLYYVAMTRARETLTLLRVDDAHSAHPLDEAIRATTRERAVSLLQPLKGATNVIERDAPAPDISNHRLYERHVVCGMQDVVLSFAGWRSAQSSTHCAIAQLNPGDPLSLVHANGYCELFDGAQRQHVGRMAKKWTLPTDTTIVRASVHGIFVRRASDGADEELRQQLQTDTWEVVVPNFVARPQSLNADH